MHRTWTGTRTRLWARMRLRLPMAATVLTVVVASLALELGSEPAPPQTPPIQFRPPGGHPMPQ